MTVNIRIDGIKRELTVHPYANCYEYMDDKGFNSLVNSIKEIGLTTQISLWDFDDKTYLLDGRNRLKALRLIQGNDCPDVLYHDLKQVHFKCHDEADMFIRGCNEDRRHLTQDCLLKVVRLKREARKDINEQAQKEAGKKGGRGKKKNLPPKNGGRFKDRSGETRTQLSEEFEISTGKISQLEKIWDSKNEELIEAMETEKISPSLAHDIVKTFPSHEEQNELLTLPTKKEIRKKVNQTKEIKKVKPDNYPTSINELDAYLSSLPIGKRVKAKDEYLDSIHIDEANKYLEMENRRFAEIARQDYLKLNRKLKVLKSIIITYEYENIANEIMVDTVRPANDEELDQWFETFKEMGLTGDIDFNK